MNPIRTQKEATSTARVLAVAAAPSRKRVYLYNKTTVTVNISIGPETSIPDAAFASFPLLAGQVWTSDPGPADDEIHAFFDAADAGKFLKITEVF